MGLQMTTNREVLAKYIVRKFVGAISGTDQTQWVRHNPEDRIYVGKLSPQGAEDLVSSGARIKQIGVDFRIPKKDVDRAVLKIFPQGNFFFRVWPSLEQQRRFFLENFNDTYADAQFDSFDALVAAYDTNTPAEDRREHKVPLLPVYEKIAIDRHQDHISLNLADIYNPQLACGRVPPESPFYTALCRQVDNLCAEVKAHPHIMPCQFRGKIRLADLRTESAWNALIDKQCTNEEFDMLPRFDYSLRVDLKGYKDELLVRVALSNESPWEDETAGYGQTEAKLDRYRIPTLFNSGLKIQYTGTEPIPLALDYFTDDYKYDRFVYALGNNCNVVHDAQRKELRTTHVPWFVQKRLKTNDRMAILFEDLIRDPVGTLRGIHAAMKREVAAWQADFARRQEALTAQGRGKFSHEIAAFEMEIKRFAMGITLIERYNMIREAFCFMNETFWAVAKRKGYQSWRLFQIVFIVSLILDIVAHEEMLSLEDDVRDKAKTDDVDVLYFPTGGGKTEAFLGVLVFNLFFDRIRGKEYGVTALLKYPLRLLSVQQVQRVANILAAAERIRQKKDLGGSVFSLGYYVGEGNTPNQIDNDLKKSLLESSPEMLDAKYRLLDVCPFCGQESVHVRYDEKAHALLHICGNTMCASRGRIPLYMVDHDIYRYLPSVIISTVDKLTALGFNSNFHNLIYGATHECPVHGFTAKRTCLVYGCSCEPAEYRAVSMKDPAPTLMIQDELHLIRESLGAYDAHYETLLEYFIRQLSGCGRGLKVIGATATISAYAEQVRHLYWKDAIRFPAESPYLNRNFYSFVDEEDIGRIIIGFAPFGKAIIDSVAYSLQYLKRVVWNIYCNPEDVLTLPGMQPAGTREEQVKELKALLNDYWMILEYNNVKLESNRVLQTIEDRINTELQKEGIQTLRAKKMTGDDSFQDVRETLSRIEHADDMVHGLDFNMIAATSMISHGVDADRFNLMLFYGIPGNTAEYIQAYSRVGRKHTGIVIDIMRPLREKDQSYLRHFMKFHEYKDILVDTVAINRWAAKAVVHTLPGVLSSLLINHYLYLLQDAPGMKNISMYGNLRTAIEQGAISPEKLKEHAYAVYKCSEEDSSVGSPYRRTIDQSIDRLFDDLRNRSFDQNTYITQVFQHCHFKVMLSLRDTDKQLIVAME